VSGVEEATTTPEPSPVADELAAMRKLVNALEALDHGTQARVLRWLVNRYQAVSIDREERDST
jgi:hypothetical protein